MMTNTATSLLIRANVTMKKELVMNANSNAELLHSVTWEQIAADQNACTRIQEGMVPILF